MDGGPKAPHDAKMKFHVFILFFLISFLFFFFKWVGINLPLVLGTFKIIFQKQFQNEFKVWKVNRVNVYLCVFRAYFECLEGNTSFCFLLTAHKYQFKLKLGFIFI